MKLILLLLAIVGVVVAISMFAMWYLFLLGLILVVAAVSLSFWLTVFLVNGLTGSMELAQAIGIGVALLVFIGIAVWGIKRGTNLDASK